MASLFRDTKLCYVKTVTVDSTMSSVEEIAKIPRGSRILGFIINGAAVASATISLGSSSSANEFLNAYSVASGYANFASSVKSTALGTVRDTDISVNAIVSAASGTWQVSILFSQAN